MHRPDWLKDEYKFVIFRRNTDDDPDFFESYVKTEEEAIKYVERETAAYGDSPEFQFYYKEL